MGPIVTLVLSIVAVLLKSWQDSQPGRAKEIADEETQRGRRDIADGNDAAVSRHIDRLLADPAGAAGDPVGEHDTSVLLDQFARQEGVVILPDRA